MRNVPKQVASVVVLAALIASGCGGATRSDWARSVAPICDRYERVAGRHEPPADATQEELADELDALLVDMKPYLSELRAVDQPDGDDQVARWVALQGEGQGIIRDFAGALRADDRAALQDASVELVEFTGRDRQAAEGLGLPASCVSDAPARSAAH
ncbi:MAG: hypothetical protein JWL76_1852 [Thermoleophilia bacterium]|nr:hypothetical protein [Thermoleophilia bacterium]